MSDALAPAWRVWIAANLLRGRPAAELVTELVARGLDEERAAAEVLEAESSPGVVAAREALRAVQLAQRLRRAHLRLGQRAVPVVGDLDATEFLDRWVAPQTPVVLTGLMRGWPALAWTWEGLADRFGDALVQVCEGRLGVERPDREFRRHLAQRPFRDVVRRVLDPSTGNDLYVTANNRALGGPLGTLLDGMRPSDILLAERLAISDVWIGPAGARTPLHHDTSDVLLCQVLGRKRLLLAPPEEVELADHAVGFWCDLDLDDADGLEAAGLAGLAVREVVVGPGDTLLIPAGWWHQVVSLEPTLTLTFAGLPHRNEHTWYRPGHPDPDAPAPA